MLVVEPDYLPDSEVLCFSVVFIPHEDFTPQKYVHSSMWGSVEGGVPPLRGPGGISPWMGGLGAASLDGGLGVKPPKEKFPCKCIL
jgi:hypothetical protein